jgi:hypothetical protein
MTGVLSWLVAAPTGAVGLGLTIPGVILTTRGATGLGQAPKEHAVRPAIPEISVGPGSAVVTVPF